MSVDSSDLKGMSQIKALKDLHNETFEYQVGLATTTS
jgi:hypothetical protein